MFSIKKSVRSGIETIPERLVDALGCPVVSWGVLGVIRLIVCKRLGDHENIQGNPIVLSFLTSNFFCVFHCLCIGGNKKTRNLNFNFFLKCQN